VEKTLAAAPTEYRGVCFDSKSEAVFARLLDLNGIEWVYAHPINHHGHQWDFLIWSWDANTFLASPDGADGNFEPYVKLVRTRPLLIELKPSPPTVAYMRKLSRRLGEHDQHESRMIVYGNPWQDGVLCKTFGHTSECTYFASLLTNGQWSEFSPLAGSLGDSLLTQDFGYGFDSRAKLLQARSYRFDLQ
jgi:hypothetical protein